MFQIAVITSNQGKRSVVIVTNSVSKSIGVSVDFHILTYVDYSIPSSDWKDLGNYKTTQRDEEGKTYPFPFLSIYLSYCFHRKSFRSLLLRFLLSPTPIQNIRSAAVQKQSSGGVL